MRTYILFPTPARRSEQNPAKVPAKVLSLTRVRGETHYSPIQCHDRQNLPKLTQPYDMISQYIQELSTTVKISQVFKFLSK